MSVEGLGCSVFRKGPDRSLEKFPSIPLPLTATPLLSDGI